MQKVKKVLVSMTAACCLMFAASLTQAADVEVWGSTTCQKRFLEPGNDALKKATNISVKVNGVGTGKGVIGLIEGKTSVAAASETLEEAIKSAQKAAKEAGIALTVPGNLQFHEITKDSIVPIVHKGNPVSALSWTQLADIHTGKITNWKEVGGPDLPVVVVTSHAGSATRAVFQALVMKKAEYVAKAIEVRTTQAEINEVDKAPGAIGAVSKGFFDQNPKGTKMVKTDLIERPLALITVGPPTPEVQKIIQFYRSPEGQKQIK